MARKPLSDVPSFPIAPILEALGMENVPTGFGWVRCQCPFHQDRTASASVNHEKNRFRCFGCEREGDALQLLMDSNRISFRDALELAQQLTGLAGEPNKMRRKRRPSELLRQEG